MRRMKWSIVTRGRESQVRPESGDTQSSVQNKGVNEISQIAKICEITIVMIYIWPIHQKLEGLSPKPELINRQFI